MFGPTFLFVVNKQKHISFEVPLVPNSGTLRVPVHYFGPVSGRVLPSLLVSSGTDQGVSLAGPRFGCRIKLSNSSHKLMSNFLGSATPLVVYAAFLGSATPLVLYAAIMVPQRLHGLMP